MSDILKIILRQCSRCGVEKSPVEFKQDHRCTGIRAKICRQCSLEIKRNRNRTPKGKALNRAAELRRKYGITEDQYKELLLSQDNCCAICKAREAGQGRVKNFAVDHCHLTGVIRGLLCKGCNTALGLFQDNVTLLRNAADYLEENQNG